MFGTNALEDLSKFVERNGRPQQIDIPRRRMDLNFSVNLMRSSYNAVDELDFVAMDEFQKAFFLFRQSEWEDYKNRHSNLMQGDLADANYFDFISFAQYATISEKCRNGLQEFVEKEGADGISSIVRRNPQYRDNRLLPLAHSNIVGDKILSFILEKYPSITPKIIENKDSLISKRRITFQQFLIDAQQLLDIFTLNSFDILAEISPVAVTNTQPSSSGSNTNSDNVSYAARIFLRCPANLWSQQVLRARKDSPVNDFELKVLGAYAARNGLQLQVLSSVVNDLIDVVHLIKLTPS